MEGDGAKVNEIFRKTQPDICVLDIMLPNKDGFAIADEIRMENEESTDHFSYCKKRRPRMW